MKTMLLFPGQGSQYIGMGKDVFERYTCSKKIFLQANNVLNRDLVKLVFEGSEDELKKSYNTQPALMMVSIAIYLGLKEEFGSKLDNLNIAGVAGHSLGEYSALCVSSCLSFIETIDILQKRGKAMSACVSNDTGMLAVIGCDRETIQKNIDTIKPKCLVIANSNSIGQIVVSGYLSDIDMFRTQIGDKAKKLIKLPVSGAFHSPLMQKAQDSISEEIEKLSIKCPKYPILQNYSGNFEQNTDNIKTNLQKQITAPVLWCENMQLALSNGFDTFIEIGAKNVLSGLMKRIISKDQEGEIRIINIENVDDIKNVFNKLQ